MTTFSAPTFYGWNLHEFSKSDDDFSAEEAYVPPSDGHIKRPRMTACQKTLTMMSQAAMVYVVIACNQ